MDNAQKCDILENTAIEAVYFERFDLEYAKMPPEEFVRKIIVGKLNAKLVAVGFNYRFGHRNEGTADALARYGAAYGFDVTVVGPYMAGRDVVSSTIIRRLLGSGDVEGIPQYLGRLFSVKGTVREGLRLGRTIGVPTANVYSGPATMSPPPGVYATSCKVSGRMFRGVTSVGNNPTIGQLRDSVTETYMFGFSDDIYNAKVEVFFHRKLRDIVKFPDLGALKSQIGRDIDAAGGYFS
jgi:riboflavin kinase/FMN adenylyltransferase